MPADEICEPCANAIHTANNGDTVNLCSVCCRKGEAVQALIGWRCVSRREIVHLKFDPPVSDSDSQHASMWSEILKCMLVAIGILLAGCGLVWAWHVIASTT